jgi:hypothetical protein
MVDGAVVGPRGISVVGILIPRLGIKLFRLWEKEEEERGIRKRRFHAVCLRL